MLCNHKPQGETVRILLPIALAVLAALTFTAPATADVWVEMGDAGRLPDTAQVIFAPVSTPLDAIIGTISSLTDVDMYQIFIPNPAAFSATTVGQPGTLLDTQLFLFNVAGFGVEANDDVAVGSFRSSLPAGNPNAPTTPGLYYIAISAFNNDPVAPGGLFIFPNPSGIGMTVGPDLSAGGDLPVSGWTDLGFSQGTYQIALTGAQFVTPTVIPEPASLVLFGVGLLGVLGRLRRRRAA